MVVGWLRWAVRWGFSSTLVLAVLLWDGGAQRVVGLWGERAAGA